MPCSSKCPVDLLSEGRRTGKGMNRERQKVVLCCGSGISLKVNLGRKWRGYQAEQRLNAKKNWVLRRLHVGAMGMRDSPGTAYAGSGARS